MLVRGHISLFPGFGQRYGKTNVGEAVRAYCELANRVGMAPVTLALAFIRSKWFVSSTIIGATNMEQLRQNIDSAEVELSADILREVEAIHERYPNPAP